MHPHPMAEYQMLTLNFTTAYKAPAGHLLVIKPLMEGDSRLNT